MWMHNGGLGGWKQIKRRLGERLADKWYLGVNGGTDSEWAFALFLDTLERMGYDPSSQPEKGFGPTVLRRAVLRTIQLINELIDQIPESILHSENVDTRSLLNFAVTDGHTTICTRYINSATDEAASLYYSTGTQWEREPVSGNDYQMERRDKGADVVLVASEPLTFERGTSIRVQPCAGVRMQQLTRLPENWVTVPTNSILTIHGQTVMVHPIMDQYYSRNPCHIRSAAFVQTKGLTANEKISATPLPGAASPVPALETTESGLKMFHPKIPIHMMRSRPDSEGPNGQRTLVVTNISEPSADIRTLTAPQLIRQTSAPSQGNIKKKRMSLGGFDHVQTGTVSGSSTASTAQPEPPGAMEPEEPPRNFGDPNKIAQFFPELTLSP